MNRASATVSDTTSFRLAEESLAHERTRFVRQTLFHLAGALVLLIVLEALFLTITDLQTHPFGWLTEAPWRGGALLGLAVLLGVVAQRATQTRSSVWIPYFGLNLSLLLEATLLLPLLLLARQEDAQAPLATALGVLGLSAGLLTLGFWTCGRLPVKKLVLCLSGGALAGLLLAVLWAGTSTLVLSVLGGVVVFVVLVGIGLVVVTPQHDPELPVAATQALLAIVATLVWLGLRQLWQLYLSQE